MAASSRCSVASLIVPVLTFTYSLSPFLAPGVRIEQRPVVRSSIFLTGAAYGASSRRGPAPSRVSSALDRWCSRAQRSRIPEFVKAARTIRNHKDGIAAAIDLTNGRYERLNNKIRSMINRGYGFHSAEAPWRSSCWPADRSHSNCHTTHRFIHIHGSWQ